jgi:hypothetical protein
MTSKQCRGHCVEIDLLAARLVMNLKMFCGSQKQPWCMTPSLRTEHDSCLEDFEAGALVIVQREPLSLRSEFERRFQSARLSMRFSGSEHAVYSTMRIDRELGGSLKKCCHSDDATPCLRPVR